MCRFHKRLLYLTHGNNIWISPTSWQSNGDAIRDIILHMALMSCPKLNLKHVFAAIPDILLWLSKLESTRIRSLFHNSVWYWSVYMYWLIVRLFFKCFFKTCHWISKLDFFQCSPIYCNALSALPQQKRFFIICSLETLDFVILEELPWHFCTSYML